MRTTEGKLFRVRVLKTGEARIARYHRFALAGRPLKFPCFADPDHPEDYRRSGVPGTFARAARWWGLPAYSPPLGRPPVHHPAPSGALLFWFRRTLRANHPDPDRVSPG